MPITKRETAKKCDIKELLNGRYIKREGWEPNYLETNFGKISRVNLLGVIISKNEFSLIIDDGSGQITIRSFDDNNFLLNKNVGDVIMIIGRPRVFNEQTFIVPEIIKKINNLLWIKFRKLELKKLKLLKKVNIKKNVIIETKKTEKSEIKEPNSNLDITDSLIQKISELDKGYGVKIDDVIKHFEVMNANKTISKLIEQGDIFEIKPGVIKII